MSLSEARIREIEELSFGILFDYYGTQSTPLPIEVVELAEWSGLQVVLAEFEEDGIAGCFEPLTSTIKVNAHEPYVPRTHFTIAHEMGHHFLHREERVDVLYRRDVDNPGEAVSVPEQEANWFAAALLMPGHCIARFRLKNPQMAKKFEVSHSAMTYRLKNLGYVR
jgi:Zn-dependent peptidase ImmA (M78 family)